MFKNEDLDFSLRQNLNEIFVLPSVAEIECPKNNDLVLDVAVTRFQSGDAWNFLLGSYEIPLFWRPQITVSARLYYLKSQKTKSTYTITEKIKWRDYFDRLLTLRALFRFRPLFDAKDMEHLLWKASHSLLLKIQNTL